MICLLLPALHAAGQSAPLPAPAEKLTRIAFGSCAKQNEPQPIWNAIGAANPQLFIFLGDNIYADTTDMNILRREYGRLAAVPEFKSFRSKVPIIATWDDHDYGANDIGSEYPMKEQSRAIFLDFWEEPRDSQRRKHAGVYTSYTFGPESAKIQIILLDTRFFRTPHKDVAAGHKVIGQHAINADPSATVLGAEQWKWLEGELHKPADLRIIGSSIQFLADYYGIEGWADFPLERERMIKAIRDSRSGAVILSGDVHWGEIARIRSEEGLAIYDATSSGLTHTHGAALPNKQRIGSAYTKKNFGMIELNWEAADPAISLQVRDETGAIVVRHDLGLSELRSAKR
ncbi:alkaline phosphatase family protein [Candidatus Sumerlaeota bacterium]|nr:alkaline phosphatase family protein [Candidatus Sumerlaeota bacterium]